MMRDRQASSFDACLDALADVERRRLLYDLLTEDPQRGPSGLTVDGETTADAVRMHHVHLPKLETQGFIEWDPERGEITRGPAFGEIAPMLTVLDDHEAVLPPGWL